MASFQLLPKLLFFFPCKISQLKYVTASLLICAVCFDTLYPDSSKKCSRLTVALSHLFSVLIAGRILSNFMCCQECVQISYHWMNIRNFSLMALKSITDNIDVLYSDSYSFNILNFFLSLSSFPLPPT